MAGLDGFGEIFFLFIMAIHFSSYFQTKRASFFPEWIET